MIGRLRYIILCVIPLVVTGCVTWQDVVDTVATSWDTIVCWAVSLVSSVLQAFLDFAVLTVTLFSYILPVVDLPVVTFDSAFMSAIAYFVPVSEVATVFVSVFTAIIGFYGVMVVLRWLKVVK